MYYVDENNELIDVDRLEKEVYSDTFASVSQFFTPPEGTSAIWIRFNARNNTIIKDLKISSDEQLSIEEITE